MQFYAVTWKFFFHVLSIKNQTRNKQLTKYLLLAFLYKAVCPPPPGGVRKGLTATACDWQEADYPPTPLSTLHTPYSTLHSTLHRRVDNDKPNSIIQSFCSINQLRLHLSDGEFWNTLWHFIISSVWKPESIVSIPNIVYLFIRGF